MSNDSTPGGFAGLIEKIKKWSGPFIGVALFVFGLRNGVKEVQENITWAVAAGVSVTWLFLFWVYTSRAEREVWEGIDQQPKIEKAPQYPKWRKWALTGMILLPLLTISGFVVAEYIERRPSDKALILIADLQGDDRKHAVTQTLLNRMRRAISEFPEVQIKPLGKMITEQEGNEAARKIGEEHKANIVVWGFYDEALNGTIHIELMRGPRLFSMLKNEMDFGATIADDQEISVKEVLSGEMSLLALLLVGVTRYEAKDFDGAIARFTKALEQPRTRQPLVDLSKIFVYRGHAYYRQGQLDQALANLSQAIKLKPDDANGYIVRGFVYEISDNKNSAIADYLKSLELATNPLYRNFALERLRRLGVNAR